MNPDYLKISCDKNPDSDPGILPDGGCAVWAGRKLSHYCVPGKSVSVFRWSISGIFLKHLAEILRIIPKSSLQGNFTDCNFMIFFY